MQHSPACFAQRVRAQSKHHTSAGVLQPVDLCAVLLSEFDRVFIEITSLEKIADVSTFCTYILVVNLIADGLRDCRQRQVAAEGIWVQ